MAKRSDFAQKLLDDLRLRKERMTASQSSKGSKPPGDAYTYSKQVYKGSRKSETQNMGFRNGTTHKSSGGNRSLTVQETSKQIVPFDRGRSSEKIGDLSMALAFAIENGGKLRRMNSKSNGSVLSFLHQMANRSMDLGKMERHGGSWHHSSNMHIPTFSHPHVVEISKGAQKLNQILKAWSNGLSFDRHSVEIGKELLKGAIDLQESLQMLINLQETSDYMITPQSKARITLLDEDEDDCDDTITKDMDKQLARPRFSFDKHSANSHYHQEVGRGNLRQSTSLLAYPSEAMNSKSDANAISKSHFFSHKRSGSYSPNSRNQTDVSAKQNKGRIPNVIAKLMGLEDLPQDSKQIPQKESGSKQKDERIVVKKSTERSSRSEHKTRDTENLVPPIKKQKQAQPVQISVGQGSSQAKQGQKNLTNERVSHGVHLQYVKAPGKSTEGIKPSKGSYNASTNIDNVYEPDQSTGSKKDEQEKERQQDHNMLHELNGKGNETKEIIPRNELQKIGTQAQKRLEVTVSLQAGKVHDIKDANRLLASNRPTNSINPQFQQHYVARNVEQEHAKHQAGKIQQQSVKNKTQAIRKKEIEAMPRKFPKQMNNGQHNRENHSPVSQPQENHINKTSPESIEVIESKGFATSKQKEYPALDGYSMNSKMNLPDSMKRNSDGSFVPADPRPEHGKEKTDIPPVLVGNSPHLISTHKIKGTKVQKAETLSKIEEPLARRSETSLLLTRPLKHQTSILQEIKERTRNKLNRPKETSRSTKMENSLAQPNMPEVAQVKTEDFSNIYSPPVENGFRRQDSSPVQIIILPEAKDQQAQENQLGQNGLSSSHNIVPGPLIENHEGKTEISFPILPKEPKPQSELAQPEPLTEMENNLKKIMMTSQTFLNTAGALFKLNIPFNILHPGIQTSHDQESNLLIDCSYDIMKRKGRRQELTFYPFAKASPITSLKVTTLDELIKQLYKDSKELKFYGRSGNSESLVEDYLPKMLMCDVYGIEPDVNCMWDYGWDEKALAIIEKYDVVRDVEKYVLNGLLDEVTRDMINIF